MSPPGRKAGSSSAAKARSIASVGSASLELVPEEPPFEFLESKVQVPPLRPGLVSRTALVNRLRATTSIPVVTVVAPAGYGKTTMLSQWAARDSRSFAWVTLDENILQSAGSAEPP